MQSSELSPELIKLAQPDSVEAVGLNCWFMDDSDEDQRLPHKRTPNEAATAQHLRDVGVVSWKLDADNHEHDEKLNAIRKVRNYTYQDIIEVCPERLPGYEQKIKNFYEEHLHDDEEIRYVLDGSGYFDVRDRDDRWIRIECKKGDMIVLPEGMYHRFTLDERNYIKAMRLFVGDPVWTPINRGSEGDAHPARTHYLSAMVSSA